MGYLIGIIIVVVVFVIGFVVRQSRSNQLKQSGLMQQRAAGFMRKETIFTSAVVMDARQVFNAMDRNTLSNNGIEVSMSGASIILNGRHNLRASLVPLQPQPGVSVFKYRVDHYVTKSGSFSDAAQDAPIQGNAMLTAVERAFLQLDPKTQTQVQDTTWTRS